ncbi:hypothetical protein PSPO01_15995 [Paraphaeosphaeria sporulosa]
MAASASLIVGSLPFPASIFLPIVEPGIDRVRFARGAPGASVSISVGGSMSISLFSSCALALPNSAAFGVLVRARPDRRVGDALFTSDSITKTLSATLRPVQSYPLGRRLSRPQQQSGTVSPREVSPRIRQPLGVPYLRMLVATMTRHV